MRCVSFLGSFAKQLQKVTRSLVMFPYMEQATPTRRIILELHIWYFHENVYIDTDFV
jgi:hypothetical protein